MAFRTWDVLQKGRGVDYQIGEETITDFNVLELKTRHSGKIFTKTFTKAKEGKTGADWEWWFRDKNGLWLGFRVQAKIIELESSKFAHLHYYTKKKGANGNSFRVYQSDKLVERALNNSPKRIPLYCLYAQWPNNSVRINWRCGTFGPTPESFGCSILSAFKVINFRNQNETNKLSEIINDLSPWHCLVCCQGYSYNNDGLVTKIYNYWRNVILERDKDEVFSNQIDKESEGDGISSELIEAYNNIEPTRNPPSYVIGLLNNELEEPPTDLNRVTIFSEE
nr:DUF6615 family protein [Fodinibius saliphilus]